MTPKEYSRVVHKALLECLLLLKQYGPTKVAGICTQIRHYNVNHEISNFDLRQAFACIADRWPQHSGDIDYPVPHPRLDPKSAYMIIDDLWEGEYGDARRALLDFVINQLENACRPTQAILNALIAIRSCANNEENNYSQYFFDWLGICGNLNRYFMFFPLPDVLPNHLRSDIRHIEQVTFTLWPEYSGNIAYPVPVPGTSKLPLLERAGGAEKTFRSTINQWEGEYGALRRNLLDFMIDHLENNQ